MSEPTKVRSVARTLTLLGALALLAPSTLRAQDMTGRWRLELHTGVGFRVNSGVTTSVLGVETKTGSAGLLGAVGFARWFSKDVAGTISAGVLSVRTETRAGVGGVDTRTAMVMPIFVGVRRYLASSDPERGARFFGSLEAGPVMGHESASSVGNGVTVESVTRSAFGGRVGAGVEFALGSRATLGLVGGYAFITDFSEPVGGQVNHSGPDLGVSLGILFGG